MQLKLNWGLGPAKPKTELKSNIDAFGDKLSEKEIGIIRFAGHNVNGIKYSPDKLGSEEISAMHEMEIDALAMMETNINWTHDAKASLMAMANLRFNGVSRCVTSGGTSNKEGYLPGGTALITQGKLCGRVMQRGFDPIGSFTAGLCIPKKVTFSHHLGEVNK